VRRRLFTRGRRAADTDDAPCANCAQEGVRPFGLLVPPEPIVGPPDVLARTPGRVDTVVDGQLLVFDPRSGNAHLLNPSAALVLTSVDGRMTVEQVVDDLARETGVDRDVLSKDVTDALATLVQSGLVTWFFRDPPEGSSPDEPGGPVTARRDRWAATVERRLDAASWPMVIECRLAGTAVVTIRSDDEAMAAALGDAVASLPAAGPDEQAATLSVDHRVVQGRDRYRVHVGGHRLGWADDPTHAVGFALAGLNQLVADGTDGRLLVHAGAVERDGRVAIVAGNSGRGKSTLTAALVGHGLSYLSDELAIVDLATRQVSPYPKALELDDAAAELLGLPPRTDGAAGERHVAPAGLGPISLGGVLSLLVLLDGPGAGGQEPVALAPADAMLRLLSDVLPRSWQVPGALDALAEVCEQVPAVLLPRLGLDAAVDEISGRLGAL
jgi:PqqD family protein of HPr-rel-A system